MKAPLLAFLALASAVSSFSQVYSARRLTRQIAPQPVNSQPAGKNPNPQPEAPAAAATPMATQPVVPVAPAQQLYRAPAVAAAPADRAKAAATKAKNDEKQFEFFKRRAEEGSDHAQYELGIRYLAGRGMPVDEKLGKEWLAKAAKNGNTQAEKKLVELGGE